MTAIPVFVLALSCRSAATIAADEGVPAETGNGVGGAFTSETGSDGGIAPAVPIARVPWNGAATGSTWATDELLAVKPLRPRFRWDGVADANRYELQIDDDCTTPGFAECGFSTPELSIFTEDIEYVPDTDLPISVQPPVGARYFWRVRACAGSACSAWPSVRYVDVGRLDRDFNGDGHADVVVGAEEYATDNQGTVFVYYGTVARVRTTHRVELSNPDGFFGSTGFGAAFAHGDLNGDGYSDLLVGASGGIGGGESEVSSCTTADRLGWDPRIRDGSSIPTNRTTRIMGSR